MTNTQKENFVLLAETVESHIRKELEGGDVVISSTGIPHPKAIFILQHVPTGEYLTLQLINKGDTYEYQYIKLDSNLDVESTYITSGGIALDKSLHGATIEARALREAKSISVGLFTMIREYFNKEGK